MCGNKQHLEFNGKGVGTKVSSPPYANIFMNYFRNETFSFADDILYR